MKGKKILAGILSSMMLVNICGTTLVSYAADRNAVQDATAEKEIFDLSKTVENMSSLIESKQNYSFTNVMDILHESEGNYYEILAGLSSDTRTQFLEKLSKEETYQFGLYSKYAFVEEMIEYKEKEELKESDMKVLASYVDIYAAIVDKQNEEAVSVEHISKLDEEVYETLVSTLDEEAAQDVKDFTTYAEYLQTLTDLDVMKVLEELNTFTCTNPENLTKTTKEFKNFVYATYGFDDLALKDEETNNPVEEAEKTDSNEAEKKKNDNTVPYATTSSVQYRTHIANSGWLGWVKDGATSGTTGQKTDVQAIEAKLDPSNPSNKIQYRAHVATDGWLNWVENGTTAGTVGQSKDLQAFQMRLSGPIAEEYHIQYRAHVANVGWQNWVENGATAGTTGQSQAIEAIQIRLVKTIARNENTGAHYCSLQEAVQGATSGQTIVLLGNTNISNTINITKNITLKPENGNWVIKNTNTGASMFNVTSNGTLTLSGNGNYKLTMDAASATKPIVITNSGATFNLKDGVTLQNSKACGLAILKGGTANMSGGLITGNINRNYRSQSPTGNTYNGDVVGIMLAGGGVQNNGTFNISGGTISKNDIGYVGGGIYNSGTLNMTGGIIDSNTAWYGGGIYNDVNVNNKNSIKLSITGGVISNNKTRVLTPSDVHWNNNEIAHKTRGNGGGLFLGNIDATISNVTFSENEGAYGGGLFNGYDSHIDTKTLTLNNVTFANNIAKTVGGSVAHAGGGINNHNQLVVKNCSFTGNRSEGNEDYGAAHGGAIRSINNLQVESSTFENNVAGNKGKGGAIALYLSSGQTAIKADIFSSSFTGNSAYSGGSIHASGSDNTNLNIKNSTFENNKALIGDGGGIENYSNLSITGGKIKNNATNKNGSGIYQGHELNISNDFSADTSNDIYLPKDRVVTIISPLSISGTVARITPEIYELGRRLVTVSYDNKVASDEYFNEDQSSKFILTPKDEFTIRPGDYISDDLSIK